jgi:hypothetical protein
MRINLVTALAALAICSAASAARAEEEHRELGAHEHGHGTLNIAVEDKHVSMELEVPGMDVVGFEHEARTTEQKSAVEKAKAELSKPLALFKLPAPANCSVKEAKVEIETEHEEGEDHDAHAKEEKAEAQVCEDHDKAEHAGEEHEDEEGHNAFHVTYALDCEKPANLTSLTFDYFKTFTGAQKLTVNVVTAKAQNKYEVSRDKPELDLGGMM